MKRTATTLVEYSDPDSDSDDESTPDASDKPAKDLQPTKRRYVRKYNHLQDIYPGQKVTSFVLVLSGACAD